jgi:3-deoxy-D-manno-octulosonate 8-phosphate phosphatase (KDO 8-P phosphatase)
MVGFEHGGVRPRIRHHIAACVTIVREMATVRCLCLDVDGVLTDGRILIDEQGRPLRAFDVQDGLAIEWFQRLGGVVAIVTGKRSAGVEKRAAELGIRHVIQGSRDKLADVTSLVWGELGIGLEQTAAIGDDLPDLPVLRRCGYPMAVANAAAEVRAAARYVTARCGGHGAVREAIEHLLELEGKWAQVVAQYEAQPGGPRETARDAADGRAPSRKVTA